MSPTPLPALAPSVRYTESEELAPGAQPLEAQPTIGLPTASPSAAAMTGPDLLFDERYHQAGTFVDAISSSGKERKFRVHIPPGYTPERAMALVLAFHAALSDGRDLELQSGLSVKADEAGFVLVYPQSLPASPAAAEGPGRWDTRFSAGNRDEAFIRDLIVYLQSQLTIDSGGIYATGFSNGATFVDLLACTLSDGLAAIASMSGGYADPEVACRPGRAVPVLFFHGTLDLGVQYVGPEWSPDWVGRYHCDTEPLLAFDQYGVTGRIWQGCDDGSLVAVYTVDGGGHTWFKEPIDATEVLWGFFQAHHLP